MLGALLAGAALVSLLLARYGDRIGRKSTLIATLMLSQGDLVNDATGLVGVQIGAAQLAVEGERRRREEPAWPSRSPVLARRRFEGAPPPAANIHCGS